MTLVREYPYNECSLSFLKECRSHYEWFLNDIESYPKRRVHEYFSSENQMRARLLLANVNAEIARRIVIQWNRRQMTKCQIKAKYVKGEIGLSDALYLLMFDFSMERLKALRYLGL